MSLATTFTSTKILELLANLQASVEATYLKKGIAPGVVAGKVPTANGDDTWTWQDPPSSGGGGGSFGGTARGVPTIEETIAGGGAWKELLFSEWVFSSSGGPTQPDLLDQPDSDGTVGIKFLDAGWYSVTARFKLGLDSADSEIYPDHAMWVFNEVAYDIPCSDRDIESSGSWRTAYGFRASVTTPVAYMTANQVVNSMLFWPTLASSVEAEVEYLITKHG